MLRGAYPQDVLEHFERRVGPIEAIREGDLELIARPIDFLGVNYYFPSRVRADASAKPLGVAFVEGPPPLTAMGWEVEPDGLYELLVRLHRDYGVPIAITENRAAFNDRPAGNGLVEDPDRVAYLDGHIEAVARAVADGVDVRRYFAWSLMDNFEWAEAMTSASGSCTSTTPPNVVH